MDAHYGLRKSFPGKIQCEGSNRLEICAAGLGATNEVPFMNDVISKLVSEIGETMKDFARGKLVFPAAEEAYERLLHECERLEAELTHEDASEMVRGILYHHNVHNCCLHSGVYVRRKETIIPLITIGDFSMAGRIAIALSHERADTGEGVFRIGQEKTGFSAHVVYAQKINEAGEPLLFAALSSSNHFTEDLFTRAGNIIKILFQTSTCPVQYYNYFDEVRKKADDFIDRHLDRNHDINVGIFIFRNIEKIFSHMGFHTILDVSKEIIKTLSAAFPSDALCVNPSFRMYLVFIPVLRGRDDEIKKLKVEFYYQGLSLPFQRLYLPVGTGNGRERLWYDIFQYENYIIAGDAISCGDDR